MEGGFIIYNHLNPSVCSFFISDPNTLFHAPCYPAYPSDEDVLKPRVPSDKIAEAKALKNTVAADVKILSEAREIFTGKGTCYTCHGEKGNGDGEIAESMNPPPRDFTYTPWQEVR